MIEIPAGTAAIIFDCDGTLVDTLPLYLSGWQTAFREHGGISLTASWFANRGGLSEQQLMRVFEQEHSPLADPNATILRARRAVIEQMPELREIPLVADVVRANHRKLPLAVASSGSRLVVEASLTAVGLFEFFDIIKTIEDVENPKPAPDVFLAAALGLGVPPAGCVVLEDSNEGLSAARAAGMMAIDIRPHLSKNDQE